MKTTASVVADLEAALGATSAMVHFIAPDDQIVWCSRGFLDFFHLDPPRVIGISLDGLVELVAGFVKPERRDAFRAEQARIKEKAHRGEAPQSAARTLVIRDGVEHLILVHAHRVFDDVIYLGSVVLSVAQPVLPPRDPEGDPPLGAMVH